MKLLIYYDHISIYIFIVQLTNFATLVVDSTICFFICSNIVWAFSLLVKHFQVNSCCSDADVFSC